MKKTVLRSGCGSFYQDFIGHAHFQLLGTFAVLQSKERKWGMVCQTTTWRYTKTLRLILTVFMMRMSCKKHHVWSVSEWRRYIMNIQYNNLCTWQTHPFNQSCAVIAKYEFWCSFDSWPTLCDWVCNPNLPWIIPKFKFKLLIWVLKQRYLSFRVFRHLPVKYFRFQFQFGYQNDTCLVQI